MGEGGQEYGVNAADGGGRDDSVLWLPSSPGCRLSPSCTRARLCPDSVWVHLVHSGRHGNLNHPLFPFRPVLCYPVLSNSPSVFSLSLYFNPFRTFLRFFACPTFSRCCTRSIDCFRFSFHVSFYISLSFSLFLCALTSRSRTLALPFFPS